jgi:hypothetical protein
VPTLGERVSYLEGRVEEHARQTDGIRDALSALERRFDARVQGLERRLDARCDAFDARMDRLDDRMDRLEGRMDRLDDKMSRQFVWLAGVQVTTLAAVLGAFAAAVSAFVP